MSNQTLTKAEVDSLIAADIARLNRLKAKKQAALDAYQELLGAMPQEILKFKDGVEYTLNRMDEEIKSILASIGETVAQYSQTTI